MKTHTARWFQNSPTTWLLKARACDGGAVLARIVEDQVVPHFYVWGALNFYGGYCSSRYAAQRAVRKALTQAT